MNNVEILSIPYRPIHGLNTLEPGLYRVEMDTGERSIMYFDKEWYACQIEGDVYNPEGDVIAVGERIQTVAVVEEE